MKGIDGVGLEYLPVALWMHILSFLPVKSLLAARAVCKLFLATIADSHFVTLHIRNFTANLHETLTLTLKPSNRRNTETCFYNAVCEVLEIENISPAVEHNAVSSHSKWIEEESCFNDWDSWFVAGSVDGLLLVVTLHTATLWNPSIKKSRQFPSPSDSIPYDEYKSFGLGYDISCNDYKVLAILDPTLDEQSRRRALNKPLAVPGAWVYSVKKGTWATVGMPACRDKREMSESLSFKGGLVWIEGVDSGRGYYHQLVRFDFATEKFHYTWMPYPIKNNIWVRNRLVMLDGGSSLGVTGLDSDDLASIWAMDESGMSWIRLSNIGEGVFRVGAFRNKEMMWEYWMKGARPKVSLYNEKEDAGDHYQHTSYMGVHVESLVLLN